MVTDRYNESGDTIHLYMREIGKTPLLTREEEIKLASRVRRGDKRARERMIKANLRLVVKISYDYANFGMPLLDLINEGNIGLMKAVERFNPRKGAKLSTYAALWIKQSIRRALSNQSKTIRLPVHVVDKVHKLHRANVELTETLGREPTDAELAEHLGISRAKVAQLRTCGVNPVSLDAPIGDDDDNRFSDIVEDEGALTPYDRSREPEAEQLQEFAAVSGDVGRRGQVLGRDAGPDPGDGGNRTSGRISRSSTRTLPDSSKVGPQAE